MGSIVQAAVLAHRERQQEAGHSDDQGWVVDASFRFSEAALAPGTYNVRMVGTHVYGSTLQLTSQITIGGVGEFTSIGENIPVIK